MTPTLTAYCDLDFLLSFYRGKPDRDPVDYEDDDVLWHEVHRFLLDDHTLVVVDATIDEVGAQAPLLLDLMTRGRFRNLTFDPDRHRGIGERAFHARCPRGCVFFLDGVDQGELGVRFCALFVSSADLPGVWREWADPFTVNVEPAGEGGGLARMADLGSYASPTTSLIVCDPYLIAELDRADAFEENLGALLLALLPEGPNELTVHVALVSKLFDDRKGFLLKPDEAKGRVEGFLRERRPHLDVEVSVVQPRDIPHDRRVFTDYGFFSSPYGWTLFGKGGGAVKETTLHYAPAFDANLREIAATKLRRVREAASHPSLAFEAGKPLKIEAGDVEAAFEPLDHV